jgi:hypothetical protein
MREVFTLFLHAMVTIIRLARPRGVRAVIAAIRLDATSSPDSESGSHAGSQTSLLRSHHRRFVHSTDAASACFADLEEKLRAFQDYFNKHRVRSGLKGQLPDPEDAGAPLSFSSYRWQKHCRGLYQTPIAA